MHDEFGFPAILDRAIYTEFPSRKGGFSHNRDPFSAECPGIERHV